MKTKHHRRSKYFNGNSDPENISIVSEKEHNAFHVLWDGTKSAFDICEDLNARWIDPDFVFICVTKDRQRKFLKTLQQLT